MPRHTKTDRDEQTDRIERDDGDPDDPVYVGLRHKDDTFTREAGIYHEEKNCQGIKQADEAKEYTRNGAQIRHRVPCMDCVLGVAKRGRWS